MIPRHLTIQDLGDVFVIGRDKTITNQLEAIARYGMDDFKFINESLTYDAATGLLFWKSRPREHFATEHGQSSFNTEFSGNAAGTLTSLGYIRINISGKHYRAHRIAWLLHYGAWPQNHIDHINGNPSDNRIVNLRDVSNVENHRNKKLPITNTSGTIGVYWDRRESKWAATIKVNGKRLSLGRFTLKSDAIAARQQANIQHGFHENHGRNEDFINQEKGKLKHNPIVETIGAESAQTRANSHYVRGLSRAVL